MPRDSKKIQIEALMLARVLGPCLLTRGFSAARGTAGHSFTGTGLMSVVCAVLTATYGAPRGVRPGPRNVRPQSPDLALGPRFVRLGSLLGGSWVVISRVISRATILITHIRGLITLLITTPEPPSNP